MEFIHLNMYEMLNEAINVAVFIVIALIAIAIIRRPYNSRYADVCVYDSCTSRQSNLSAQKDNAALQRKANSSDAVRFDDKLSHILNYEFPAVVTNRFEAHHPSEDLEAAKTALKLFFVTALYNQERTGRMDVEMTDEVADHLWHIFLLDTRAYAEFCDRAFGAMLHHIPYEEQKTLKEHQAKSEQAIKDMYSFLRSYRPKSYTRLSEYINERGSYFATQSNAQPGKTDDSVCCGMGAFELWFWWMILSDNSSAAVSPASATGVWCTGQSITESSPSLTTDAWSKESETTEIGHSVSSSIAHSVCGSSCRSATSSCSSSSSCGGSSSSCGGGGD